MAGAEHVGALGHEVHAAEDDELGVGMLADLLRQLEGIAGVVGELDDFVALVMMTEDDQPRAERAFGGGDAQVHVLVGQTEVRVRQRLALADVRLLVVGQQRNQHGPRARLRACENFLNPRFRKSQAPTGRRR